MDWFLLHCLFSVFSSQVFGLSIKGIFGRNRFPLKHFSNVLNYRFNVLIETTLSFIWILTKWTWCQIQTIENRLPARKFSLNPKLTIIKRLMSQTAAAKEPLNNRFGAAVKPLRVKAA